MRGYPRSGIHLHCLRAHTGPRSLRAHSTRLAMPGNSAMLRDLRPGLLHQWRRCSLDDIVGDPSHEAVPVPAANPGIQLALAHAVQRSWGCILQVLRPPGKPRGTVRRPGSFSGISALALRLRRFAACAPSRGRRGSHSEDRPRRPSRVLLSVAIRGVASCGPPRSLYKEHVLCLEVPHDHAL